METGVSHSHILNGPFSLPTHIAVTNSTSMRSTSSGSSLESRCHNIPEYSTSIGPSECASPNPTISSLQVSAASVTSLPTISSACKGTSHIKTRTNVPRTQSIPTHLFADAGTQGSVQQKRASTNMCVANAKHNIKQRTAPVLPPAVVPDARWLLPAWTRGFIWSTSCPSLTPSAMATETALPFPSVPLSELHNKTALHTIASRPDLFKIVTTINVDTLNKLLTSHPNRALVNSVCLSLRYGMWPFANVDPSAPETFDAPHRTLDATATQFTREQ